jgi:hypothetical protein
MDNLEKIKLKTKKKKYGLIEYNFAGKIKLKYLTGQRKTINIA